MSQTEKKRTITLTDAAPVRINQDDWPVIADGQYHDHDNQYEFQANRTWRCVIRVRQHTDGRMIVYGVYEYDTQFQGERDCTVRAGEVLESDADPIPALWRTGEALSDALEEAGCGEYSAHVAQTVRECIADLPAREL